MDKSYKRAIEVLNGTRRRRRPSTQSALNISGSKKIPRLEGAPDLRGIPSIFGMREWLDELGHSAADIDRLNIIHVAGTKGKGSTCAFIDSFLRVYGTRTGFPRKTGLYTSPHLIRPEERIRINFEPLSRDLFAKYFFEVHDILSHDRVDVLHGTPRYLQFFALVSLHAFIREGVEAAVLETHHGGEYDSTNVIERPIVTAITPLGMDHVDQLGPTIQNIAWHKAGIFKPGTPAFSAPQETAASNVLRNRAFDAGISLKFVHNDPSLPVNALQLEPDVQRVNCSVALAAVRSFLHQKVDKNCLPLSPSDVKQGISQFSWPGRFQLVVENNIQWFLDGAHNEMSVIKAAQWFTEVSEIQRDFAPVVRVLIFSQVSDQRDGAAVFERLATSLVGSGIKYVIFTTYKRDQSSEFEIDKPAQFLEAQNVNSAIWKRTQPNTNILFEPTIQEALETARKIGKEYAGMQSLITGSLRLVGGALSLLQPYKSGQECVD